MSLTEYMIPSTPDLTPTPNWRGLKWAEVLEGTARVRDLAVRHCRVFQTAIGLMCTSILLETYIWVPQKKGETSAGRWPYDIALRKARMADRAWPDLQAMREERASLRCSGRRPEGPGVEPDLKEWIALDT